ncbi:MAG TPA: nucleotidyltransferase family protein [Kiritimatiellia bacterium]|nr:nucleotidyltransferase family protein [Kiritimatiellia bacterium]HPS08907.1 nucleotidyltransferase family protein [Kiritimatiellia bacterium]
MNSVPDIPTEYRVLIACLRSAFTGTPPDGTPASADWTVFFRQAREHGVDTYLYPWLATRIPTLFSGRADTCDPAPPAWRTRFLEALPHASQRRRQLSDILKAFADARLDVIVLKGAWLSETVYDDPAQRTMSDIDLLVRADARDACHAVLLGLGYAARSDTLHSRFAYDQTYDHPEHRDFLELHWHVASDMDSGAPAPDIAAIWRHTSSAVFCGHPVRSLSPEDQLAHLVQHMLHHLFAAPLRVYVDIALLVRKYGDRLTPAAIEAAGARWRTGRAIPFVLRLASELLAFTLPSALRVYAQEPDAVRRSQALQALFHLPEAHERSGEVTLLRFKEASSLGRLRLVLARIFMPRTFLSLHYPCARRTCGLPLAWFRRACDLRRHNRAKIKALLTPGSAEEQRLKDAALRADLTAWLLHG